MIIKIKPDKEKAKSMSGLIEKRIKALPSLRSAGFANIIAENYYEVIKELASCILISRGFKSVGENFHKDLFDFLYLKKNFSPEEFSLVNDLRVRRNKSFYDGKEISQNYLDSKKNKLDVLIGKLKSLLDLELEK